MVLKLLPLEVDPEELKNPSSSIITPAVVKSFARSGGDFSETVPFALLQVRALFETEAAHSRMCTRHGLMVEKVLNSVCTTPQLPIMMKTCVVLLHPK